MGDLNRNAIKDANDLPLVPIEVSEWGGTIYIQALNGQEREIWEDKFLKMEKKGSIDVRGLRVDMIIRKTYTKEGNPMFQSGDKDWLEKKSGEVLTRIFNRILEESGMTLAAQEDAEKNSERTLENSSSLS